MDYPSVYVVRLVGDPKILGVYIGVDDEQEAKEQVATATGWPFYGVQAERVGDVSGIPLVVS